MKFWCDLLCWLIPKFYNMLRSHWAIQWKTIKITLEYYSYQYLFQLETALKQCPSEVQMGKNCLSWIAA